ncbi:MAG: SufS family cysteine desulfurase [Nitrospinae bacterium]|nr:SufS family cysteine desulfurase [Nitrospinota bacterium]
MSVIMEKEALDVKKIRAGFPELLRSVNAYPLVYLDNAATGLKPSAVIERMRAFDMLEYATVRRGSYKIGEEATEQFELARADVARFINANPGEVVFTSGATQSINLVASSWGRKFLKEGDEVLVSAMEHHANIVPWQMVCAETGAKLRVIPVDDTGELVMDEYARLLGPRTKIVAVTHVSNVLGTVNPVRDITAMAHGEGARVLIDGAQAIPHMKVDVRGIDCDFYVFSSHKLYGPTGLGVLYGKADVLESMPPYVTGGDMIERVTFEKTTFRKAPARFEAGTPPVTQVIGLGEAVRYIQRVGLGRIEEYERELLEYGERTLSAIPGIRFIGTAPGKASIISFTLGDIHPHDIVTALDHHGVAVRGGHHCAQPLMDRFGVPATVRASFAFYNTFADIATLAEGLREVVEVFS